MILEASRWSAWPDQGGVLDQDAFMLRDIMTYLSIRRGIEREIESYKSFKPDPDIPRFNMDDMR